MKKIRCVISRAWGYGNEAEDWYRDIVVDDVPDTISSLVLQACPPVELSTSGGIKYVLPVGSSTPIAFQEFYRPYYGGDWKAADYESLRDEFERHVLETLKAHGWTNTPGQSEETQA